MVSAGIFNHAAAKYAFVRLLRGSHHFQQNTWQHWASWIGLNVAFGAVAFVLASAIPIFNYILSLASSVCFAPMGLIFPACMWIHDFGSESKNRGIKGTSLYCTHALIGLLGLFLAIGGMYVSAFVVVTVAFTLTAATDLEQQSPSGLRTATVQ